MWLFSQRIRFTVVSTFFLFVLGFCAYHNAVRHPFVHDDIVFIQENPNLKDLNLFHIFRFYNNSGQNPQLINTYYRPLLELCYRLQYRLFGLNPHVYHLINILIHILNGILVFLILRKILSKQIQALIIAAVFIVHPVLSEAVACVSGISNLLVAFLCLLSFLMYLISRQSQSKILYTFSLILFFVSFFAKEQVVILPVIILLYEACFHQKDLAKNVKIALGFWAVLFMYFLIRHYVLKIGSPDIFKSPGELWLRILAIPQTLLTDISILVFPLGLYYYRTIDVLNPYLGPTIILFLVALGIACLIGLQERSIRAALIFGWGWFIICLLPMLNIVPLIHEYSLILMMEHFLYLPSIGFFIFLVVMADTALQSRHASKQWITAAVIILMMCLTIRQNTFWRAEIPLFERTLKFSDSARGRNLLAKAYYKDGRYEDAISENNKAYDILTGYLDKIRQEKVRQFYFGLVRDVHLDLALNYEALKNYTAAIDHYQSALKIDPGDYFLYNSLGVALIKAQRFQEARTSLEAALKLNPDDLTAKNNLAYVYIYLGNKDQAKVLLKEILFKDPDFAAARQNLEKLLSGEGRP